MTIRTLREFMEEGRKGAGTGSISDMQKEIGLLRAENLVLTRELTKSELCEGKTPQQLAGVLICNAIRVDAGDIEDATRREVIATVAVDDECFDVHVKLSLGEDIDLAVIDGRRHAVTRVTSPALSASGIAAEVRASIESPVDTRREPSPLAKDYNSSKDDEYKDRT